MNMSTRLRMTIRHRLRSTDDHPQTGELGRFLTNREEEQYIRMRLPMYTEGQFAGVFTCATIIWL